MSFLRKAQISIIQITGIFYWSRLRMCLKILNTYYYALKKVRSGRNLCSSLFSQISTFISAGLSKINSRWSTIEKLCSLTCIHILQWSKKKKITYRFLCIHNDKIMYTTSHALHFYETNLDKHNKKNIVL